MNKKALGLMLLQWHGGGGTGLYAVGSNLYAGHEPDQASIDRAIDELVNLKRDANYPECVTPENEAECNKLAAMLRHLNDDPDYYYHDWLEEDED